MSMGQVLLGVFGFAAKFTLSAISDEDPSKALALVPCCWAHEHPNARWSFESAVCPAPRTTNNSGWVCGCNLVNEKLILILEIAGE